MAMEKVWRQINERLDRIEAKLNTQPQAEAKPAVTKEQLMEINGVGSAVADKILELLNS